MVGVSVSAPDYRMAQMVIAWVASGEVLDTDVSGFKVQLEFLV